MNNEEIKITEEMELELSNGKGEEVQYNYSKYIIIIQERLLQSASLIHIGGVYERDLERYSWL